MTSPDKPAADDGPTPLRPEHDSILDQLERRIGAAARVVLHDPESGTSLAGRQQPGEVAADHDTGGRYRVQGLLGQGGVGAVHQGRDADLGRDVALKFLHERFKDRPDVLHRFVEEAQIGGQLQHPGIVPVYELGILDGRPFFAMKMVKGRTLASRLAARADVADDRGTWLAIFEQICQTMAYAHARGVVHRDLKPANVMIGSFGEVQVVDWGMGKVLPRDGEEPASAPAAPAPEPQASVIETVRSQGHGTQSLVGSVMGTPAYMPREQALGDVEAMDRRSDVFALGAILCEILTGQPPYVGAADELLAMAAFGRLDEAWRRLQQCGADPELIALATRCLQADRASRPQSARDVADAIHGHLAATEARAHEATLRAMTLKRTQKYGIALTIVIAAGLLMSLWFWRDADEAKGHEHAAREAAETNLRNFNQLSQVVRLDRARERAGELFPAWPQTIAAIDAWQRGHAEPLRKALPGLQDTLQVLEDRAEPQSEVDADRERREHPRAEELARMAAQLECWRRAAAVHAGEAEVEAVDLPAAAVPPTVEELNAVAWPLIDPDRTGFGREAEGLWLARRALSLIDERHPMWAPVQDSVAWGCLAVGLHGEAVEHSEAALATCPPSDHERYELMLGRLRRTVVQRESARHRAAIADLAATVEALRREVSRRQTWAFEDDADAFLRGTLDRLATGVEEFLRDEVADVARRRYWAERVRELTITPYAARWQEARAAIARADGKTANSLYAAVPIDLQPQLGLVPLGMNPGSKLWEFYHLRSAWDVVTQKDPAAIEVPSYSNGAEFDMNGRGIVFVLLPGGTFHMGAQSEDPSAPNYDPAAQPDEMPVTEVTLAPFFLSKYEMTQGQWARMSDGDWPSWYIVGNDYTGIPVPIMDSHPVEQVDWAMCAELMRRHALSLPTEAQWEYGCRAGTSWPWSTGPECESLEGNSNILDFTGEHTAPIWIGGEAWDDHYKGPAPVGTFAPNAFGLHDVHGNQWEWCQDWFGRYDYAPRASDGRREPELHEIIRASRGGGHQDHAALARSAYRAYRAPNTRSQNLGLRPARPVLP